MRPYLRVGCFPKYKQIIYWISSSKRLITDIFPAVFSKEASAKLENIRLTDDQSQPNSSPHFYNTLYSSFDAEINWLGSRAERNTTQKYMQVPLRANYILDTYVFLHCRAQLVFPNYLGKFQFIYNFRTHVFLDLSENLRPPLIFSCPKSRRELKKMTSFSQKYHTGWKL